jgi:ActR/RegA family two-component response regulator
MSSPNASSLEGRRLLVVEDDYFIAVELARSLEKLGVAVVGPVASVADALGLIRAEDGALDGAVLDIHLGEERVYPVADQLADQGVPFVFLTGYDAMALPEPYAKAAMCTKPVDTALLVRTLESAGLGNATG